MGWLFLAIVILAGFVDFMRFNTARWRDWSRAALDWEKLIEQSQDHAKFRRALYSPILESWVLDCEEYDRTCEMRWQIEATLCWQSVPKRLHPYYREIWEDNQC